MPLFPNMYELNFLVYVLLFAGLLWAIVFAVIVLGLWGLLNKSDKPIKCSQCGQNLISQDEEMIGIFQKGHHKGKASYYGDHTRRVQYEKYKLYYKCEYCGHSRVTYKSKKL